jgi:hypothetical protein
MAFGTPTPFGQQQPRTSQPSFGQSTFFQQSGRPSVNGASVFSFGSK